MPGPGGNSNSGFYTHSIVVCRKMKVRFSITVRQHAQLRKLIEAIPEDAWRPIPYWMDGAADVAEAEYTPFRSEPDCCAGAAHRPAGEARARFPTGPSPPTAITPS